ncbi:hypothetical protein OB955_12335 [Halobacteria archaeon AArc-m2/3/4]|uniref:Uncharacterized protein n=1 Tax=Natronoglomus mannanivorans TaxID=2979990 RepID=A0AAP2YZF8_9EURY|nr:hypothetical protein [Halobacteria archaeon AArc-xg1-1]MCU4973525.1 hypothetical protein [Halobacteria archaeon AArc-m2/3/4]
MGAKETQIVCRNCKETIDVENSACPHCGTSLRGQVPYYVAIALGVLLIGATVLNPDDLLAFGVVGVVAIAIGGFFIYEKRQRLEQASQRE